LLPSRPQETGPRFRPAREAEMSDGLVDRHKGSCRSTPSRVSGGGSFRHSPTCRRRSPFTPTYRETHDARIPPAFPFRFTVLSFRIWGAASVVAAVSESRGESRSGARVIMAGVGRLVERPRYRDAPKFIALRGRSCRLPAGVPVSSSRGLRPRPMARRWSMELRLPGWTRAVGQALARSPKWLPVPDRGFDGAALLNSSRTAAASIGWRTRWLRRHFGAALRPSSEATQPAIGSRRRRRPQPSGDFRSVTCPSAARKPRPGVLAIDPYVREGARHRASVACSSSRRMNALGPSQGGRRLSRGRRKTSGGTTLTATPPRCVKRSPRPWARSQSHRLRRRLR